MTTAVVIIALMVAAFFLMRSRPIRAVITIVVMIVVLVLVSQAVYTVDVTKQVIIIELGKYKRTITKPGLYLKIPFIQTVVTIEKRVLTSDTTPGDYLTLDKKRLKVDHVSRWRIVDPLQFYKSVRTEAGGLARLQPIVFSEMRDELAKHNFVDIISLERESIMEAVATNATAGLAEFGIELVDVRIKRADLPREVQENVFARMQAERERISKQYRAEGAEASFELMADADREKTILEAEGYDASQRLRGDGDAEAIKIYADAFELDPEFYAFLRSLEAYENFLVGETTLVLSSDSALFKYLEGPQP